MSKKNKLSTRVKAHAFDLKREEEDQEKRGKRKAVRDQRMQVEKKISKGKKLTLGKKKRGVKIKPSAATKLKASQAMSMEIDP